MTWLTLPFKDYFFRLRRHIALFVYSKRAVTRSLSSEFMLLRLADRLASTIDNQDARRDEIYDSRYRWRKTVRQVR